MMENSRANDVSLMLYILRKHFGDRVLDFQALRQIINASFDPLIAWTYLNTPCRKACHDVELRDDLIQRSRTIFVKPQDRRSSLYIFETSTEQINFGVPMQPQRVDCRDAKESSASNLNEYQEHTFRHPSLSSDDEDVGKRCNGENFSIVSTKSAQMLHGIDLVGPNGSDQCSLRPSFPLQLSIRIDDSRKRIYYDCIDYELKPVDIERSPLPTLRQVRKFSQSLGLGENSSNALNGDGEITDAILNQPVSSDLETPSEEKIALYFQAISAEYLNSFMYRIFVPLSSVVGIILRSAPTNSNRSAQQDSSRERPAVLILELNRPTADESAFAFRKVGSKHIEDNKFVTTPDWTPNAVASKATRHYIYGSLYEIKELAAHLCNIDQRIASMMRRPVTSNKSTSSPSRSREPKRQKTRSLNEGKINHEIRVTNTLCQVKCAILGYNATPGVTSLPPYTRGVSLACTDKDNCQGRREHPNETPPLVDQGTTLVNSGIEHRRITKPKLSEEEVNQRLSGILEVSNSYMEDFTCINPCLKAGIQNGHIHITQDMTEDTILYSGECHACGRMLGCALKEALFQHALIKVCADEETEPGHGIYCSDENCCAVNYISSLCTGQPKLLKNYHHCRECPDFGSCECSCADNSHAREIPRITYPPSSDAWSGNVNGLDEMVSRKMSDMDADRAMMLLSALGLKRDDSSREHSS